MFVWRKVWNRGFYVVVFVPWLLLTVLLKGLLAVCGVIGGVCKRLDGCFGKSAGRGLCEAARRNPTRLRTAFRGAGLVGQRRDRWEDFANIRVEDGNRV